MHYLLTHFVRLLSITITSYTNFPSRAHTAGRVITRTALSLVEFDGGMDQHHCLMSGLPRRRSLLALPKLPHSIQCHLSPQFILDTS